MISVSAKHLDVTAMFTYFQANILLSQSEYAYYLSYLISDYNWGKWSSPGPITACNLIIIINYYYWVVYYLNNNNYYFNSSYKSTPVNCYELSYINQCTALVGVQNTIPQVRNELIMIFSCINQMLEITNDRTKKICLCWLLRNSLYWATHFANF